MKKTRTITLALVGAVIVLGLVISRFVDWNVDEENASGNIAKSSHFSRKTADGGTSNMQELLMNDEDYKNGIVAAYIVMKTRAEQFNALVDMSAEVAGNIKEFDALLNEMKEALPIINNVCASVETAGNDLNTALGGEAANDLEQNTSNAALAYKTLQKQNKLADQFIETVDNYLQKTDANDRLKFVRDQWVDYQQMTAALNKNEKLAQELSKKGHLLSEEKSAAALVSFSADKQLASIYSASLANAVGIDNRLSLEISLRAVEGQGALNAQDKGVLNAHDKSLLNAQDKGVLNAHDKGVLNAHDKGVLNAQDKGVLNAHDKGVLNAQDKGVLNAQDKGILNAEQVSALNLQLHAMEGLEHLQNSLPGVMRSFSNDKALGQMSQVNGVLNALSENNLGALAGGEKLK